MLPPRPSPVCAGNTLPYINHYNALLSVSVKMCYLCRQGLCAASQLEEEYTISLDSVKLFTRELDACDNVGAVFGWLVLNDVDSQDCGGQGGGGGGGRAAHHISNFIEYIFFRQATRLARRVVHFGPVHELLHGVNYIAIAMCINISQTV
jgi:hypothetical protein